MAEAGAAANPNTSLSIKGKFHSRAKFLESNSCAMMYMHFCRCRRVRGGAGSTQGSGAGRSDVIGVGSGVDVGREAAQGRQHVHQQPVEVFDAGRRAAAAALANQVQHSQGEE